MVGIIVSIVLIVIILGILILCIYYSFIKKKNGCEDCSSCSNKCIIKSLNLIKKDDKDKKE